MLTLEEFLALPDAGVAQLVRQAGPQVCVLPINGTRRWYRLEHAAETDRSMLHYMQVMAGSFIRLFSLLYDAGIDTILSPAFGSDLLKRGQQYAIPILMQGLPILGMPEFMDFYRRYGLRVRFYGDYQAALNDPGYAPVLEVLENITSQTGQAGDRRLFFGLFAEDATAQVGRLAIDFYAREKKAPGRAELVSLYYGEYVKPATLFIGFEKPAAFDYPLLGLGSESLYFSAAPTPYLTASALRLILYDHLFRRSLPDPDWDHLAENDLAALRIYYRKQQETALGLGDIFHGAWISRGTAPSPPEPNLPGRNADKKDPG